MIRTHLRLRIRCMQVRRNGPQRPPPRGAGVMYRLTVAIGVEFTSASYEMAEGSEALRLSPFAP